MIADLPIEFRPDKALKEGTGVFRCNSEGAARYGFLKKDATNADDIIWINCEKSHTCFHWTNAYQEGDKIYMHGCIWDTMDFDFRTEHPTDYIGEGPWLKKMVFDLTKKEVAIE